MDRILITAATGHTGNATAKLLLERGLSVRALVRKEDERSRELVRLGAEIVTGNLRDFDSLRPAMKDVSRAYFVFPIGPGLIESTAYFAQAAVDAGIEAIVNMSQISAREDAKSHVAQDHCSPNGCWIERASRRRICARPFSRSGSYTIRR